MEKLQPIIRHHFWILFIVALILPPIAWSMTSGSLDEQTQTRIDDLDKTLSGVAQGSGAPNGDWSNAVTQLVNVRKESNRRAWNRLWDAQETLQIWPETVRPYMLKCPYRGTPADVPDVDPAAAARVMAAVPNLFRGDYEREIQRVWRIPEPKDEQNGLKAAPDAPQKVLFPSTAMPRVPQAKWQAAQPTWTEMWNAQEDLWLMSELLKAIARTNEDATSIADANVRHIRRIQLFGGERAAASSSGSTGSTGGGEPGMMNYPGMGGSPFARGAASSGGPASADFALSEEYNVKDAPAASGGGYGLTMGTEPTGGTSTANAASDPQADENRYLKQEWAYRTRGFKLQVTVHQMYVPMLYSELLKSKFPLEIVRIQQSALNPDRPGSNRTGGYASGLAAAGGSFPGASGIGGGYPGATGGYPGGEESLGGGGPETLLGSDPSYGEGGEYPGETTEFDSFGGVSGPATGAAAANNAVDSAVVSAALSDINLMDVVIVGEIYLYNEPDAAEAGAAVDATGAPSADTAATSAAALADPSAALPPAEAPAGTIAPANAQPGVVAGPGSPATLTGEVAPPANNAPATLGTPLPTDGTPAGEVPASGAPDDTTSPNGAAPASGSGAPVTEPTPPAPTPAAAEPQQ